MADAESRALWLVIREEFSANVLLSFFDVAVRGLRVSKSQEVRAYTGYAGTPNRFVGRLCQIPPTLRQKIDRMGLFDFLTETDYHPLRACVAYAM